MKTPPALPTMLALALLAGGCTMPAVQGSAPRTDKTVVSRSIPPEKPTATAPTETKGKRVSLIPKEDKKPTAVTTPPEPGQEIPPGTQPQTKIFTDYNTGLTFTYPQPWHLVSTQGEGSTLGRDGRAQLSVRFATLTTDQDKTTQRGYFYVPSDSLTGTIGKALKSILGVEETETSQGKTPIDVLLTQKHFPNLIIDKRYRGNNGGVIVQKCRHKQLPGTIQVYHIFIGDKVASYSLSEIKNRLIKLEMQQIVLSTKKP